MSVKLVTVDNDTVELKDNKVVGKDSRFDGMDVKTNADIMKVFGVKPGVNLADYQMNRVPRQKNLPNSMFYGDAGERELYMNAVRVMRGEIKGPRAEQIMTAFEGQFGQGAMDKLRQDALKGSPTEQKLFPMLDAMKLESFRDRFPEAKQIKPPMPNYGAMIPKYPEGGQMKYPTGDTIQPMFRPGVDPMGMPTYPARQNKFPGMTMGPKQLNRMLMANMMGLLS